MSKKVLVNLDMNKNQLENVVIHNLATDPETGTLGQIIYNTADKKVKQWDGSAWKVIGSDVDSALSSSSTNPVQNKVINSALGNKVDKVSGKVLSSNDYTDAEKQQLANLVAGTITVDSTLSSSSTNPVQNKVINSALNGKADSDTAVTELKSTAASTKYTVQGHIAAGDKVTFTDIAAATTSLAGVMTASDKTKLDGIASGANKITVDSVMSDSSENPVQNKVVKAAIASAIAALPKEQFLDLTKTTFVQSFAWSSTTYPDSTNPNLEGKPVMVLALKNSSDDTVAYSFLNMYELVDTYTGTSPITISGRTVSHANSGATAGSYGLASNATPAFGGTFNVPYVTVDAKGHVTAASTKTVTVPSAVATRSNAGLMSTQDKSNLNRAMDSAEIGVSLTTTTASIDFISVDGETENSAIIPAATTSKAGVMTVPQLNNLNTAYNGRVKMAYGTIAAGATTTYVGTSTTITQVIGTRAYIGTEDVVVDTAVDSDGDVTFSIAKAITSAIICEAYYI